MANYEYKVGKDCTLMDFLLETFKDKSRTTVKSYLRNRQIEVNRQIVTQFDTSLKAGETVKLVTERRTAELRHPMLSIIYEDDYIIVVNKKNGLLSIGTDREREKTAIFILSQYVKQSDSQNRVFILHRLDRETSGLMMFAKSEEVQHAMQSNWNETVTDRRYVAVTEGRMERPEGIISTYLSDSKGYKVFVSNKADGEPAVTSYKVLSSNDNNTLVELSLSTGKKNQIRAHLEYIGHSIIGDKKYGAKTNPLGRVALHAYSLCFIHPVTKEQLSFKTAIPEKFASLI